MFTEYPKVLSFFKQAIQSPNIELREILYKFAALKKSDDITAANYLITSYHEYNAHIARLTANASAK